MKKFYIALATTALTSGLLMSPVSAKADGKHHKHSKHHKFHEAAPAEAKAEGNDFQGWHMGVSLGLETGNGKVLVEDTLRGSTANSDVVYRASGDQSQKGVVGGLNFGYDHFFNQTYFAGLEIGGDLSTTEGKTKLFHTNLGPLIDLALKTDKDWAVSTALRAGMLIDRNLLAYLHVGWIGANWEIKGEMHERTAAGATRTSFVKSNKFKNGLRTGLGMAKMVNKNIQCGIDMAYTWYETTGKQRLVFSNGAGFADGTKTNFKIKYSPETFEGRVFMKWKFNGIS